MDEVIRIRYQSYDWGRQFDPDTYRRNPEAIRQLYERCLQSEHALSQARGQLEELRGDIAESEKRRAVLESETGALRKGRWLPFCLQLVASICVGLGANWFTSDSTIYGGVLIVLFILLELFALLAVLLEGRG